MIFDDLGIDPDKNLLLSIEEHRVLVHNEESVSSYQLHACTDYHSRISQSPFIRVEFLQSCDGLPLKVVHPDFLNIVLEFANDDFGSTFNIIFLALDKSLYPWHF